MRTGCLNIPSTRSPRSGVGEMCRRYGRGDRHVAGDPDFETRPFDLDLAEAGFAQQRRKFAYHRILGALVLRFLSHASNPNNLGSAGRPAHHERSPVSMDARSGPNGRPMVASDAVTASGNYPQGAESALQLVPD